MAKLRVHEWLGEDHAEAGMDWEQEAYRAGCAYAVSWASVVCRLWTTS